MSKRAAFALWEIAVILAIFATLAALLWPALKNFGGTPYPNKYRAQCASNLKRIGIAFAGYARDYDDKLPPLIKVSSLENEPLFPYADSAEGVFQCPATNGNGATSTDYFVNARLAGADKTKIANPNASIDFVILGGDGADNQNAFSHLSQLPGAWRKDASSPALRHLNGANYLFIDGHVKSFNPEQITLDKPALGTPTFAVK